MDIFPPANPTQPGFLPGLTWNIIRAPMFATRIQTPISGRNPLRVADQLYPRWKWTLSYDFLRDPHDIRYGPGSGTAYEELREIMGFYVRQLGKFGTFLYDDPGDDYVTNQNIATGDGTTTQFQLLRTLSAPAYGGLFTEPITQPNVIAGIYVGGTQVSYSLGAYGVISLFAAPGAGVPVTATFSYYWPCMFSEDTVEFENWMYQFWSLKKLSLESLLLP